MVNITEDINYHKVVYEQYRRWRIVRQPLLAELDVDYMKALETNDKKEQQRVIGLKNRLRNITTYDFSLNHATVEEAMAYWPTEILGTRPTEFDVPDPQ